ncbi:MAG: DUF951 domain-containing protein [Chloroflexota bacterium]
MVPDPDIREGDIVKMKRPHPCGGTEWRVKRIGADVGIECLRCGWRVLVERRRFEGRLKGLVRRGA